MNRRGSALALRRQEAYQRLAEIDADQLRLSGRGIEYIAARAKTTPHYVLRWLKATAPRDTPPAEPKPSRG